MSYYTHYALSWNEEELSQESKLIVKYEFKKFRKEKGLEHLLDKNGHSNDSASWYEHEKHMKELSSTCPDAVFTLYGEGEEATDMWFKYFKNGKMQVCDAKITFEDYDESKLE